MNYRDLNGKTIREGFGEFHQANPQVFTAFEKEALNAIAKGRKKLSAKNIINVIRWNGLQSTDENFSVNDAYGSYYARLFTEKHPEHKDVFEFRKLRNEEAGPYLQVEESGQLRFL